MINKLFLKKLRKNIEVKILKVRALGRKKSKGMKIKEGYNG